MTETTDLLKKLGLNRDNSSPTPTEDENETSFPCYGFVRGRSDRVLTLNLKFKTGKQTAFSYAWFHYADYDPSMGITLNFTNTLILLQGRHLAHLYECLTRLRILWVQEVDPLRNQLAETDTAIIGITIRKATQD